MDQLLVYILCCFMYWMNGCYSQQYQQIQEYCQVDTFAPECPTDQVLVITHGKYGRIRTGKCIKIADNIGCMVDILEFLAGRCSGKHTCSVTNFDLVKHVQIDCLQEMSAYFEVAYNCLQVYRPVMPRCTSPITLQASAKTQYLSSLISQETGCGLHQTPYVIEAKPGQRIKLFLEDFSGNSSKQATCQTKYGYVLDTKNDDVFNICGGHYGKQRIHTSSGDKLQVLLEKSAVEKYAFLLHFEAVGCPDLDTPRYGWKGPVINNTVSLGCDGNADKWTMTCVGSVWLGITRNCTPPVQKEATINVDKPLIKEDQTQIDNEPDSLPVVTNNHLYAVGIGCVTLIVCVTTVILGIHCTKRFELHIHKKLSVKTMGQQSAVYRPVEGNTLDPFNMSFSTAQQNGTMDSDGFLINLGCTANNRREIYHTIPLHNQDI